MNESSFLKNLRGQYAALSLCLPGLQKDSPGEFFCLAELLRSAPLELLPPKAPGDPFRIVYLMNDTVESFLVFSHPALTGTLPQGNLDDVDVCMDRTGNRYVLVFKRVRGEAAVLFFDSIRLVTDCYDYSGIGHFWRRDSEHLRQIQYRMDLMYAKCTFLDASCFTKGEQELSLLYEFPPLSALFYPASDRLYIPQKEDPWHLDPAAAEFFSDVCRQAGDVSLAEETVRYAKDPTKKRAAHVAALLREKRHTAAMLSLLARFDREGRHWGRRPFPEDEKKKLEELLSRAGSRAEAYQKKGHRALVFHEEPFLEDRDELGFHADVLVFSGGLVRQKTQRIRIG